MELALRAAHCGGIFHCGRASNSNFQFMEAIGFVLYETLITNSSRRSLAATELALRSSLRRIFTAAEFQIPIFNS